MLSNRKLIAVIAGILLLAIAACAILSFTQSGGTEVVVTVNGKEYARYPLRENRTVTIGPSHGWHNTLVVRDGKAWVSESDCDNQICVQTPALQEDLVGVIVCLPHGLVIELQ